MRIIAGKFKGKKIGQPSLKVTRPTKDRIRESVFNIVVGNLDTDTKFLDLFAGSGSFGCEAISRGCAEAVFVDNNDECTHNINRNIALLGIQDETRVINGDVFAKIAYLGKKKEKFDLIFADPPYKMDLAKKTLIMINQYDILSTSGLLIVEHHRREDIPRSQGNVFLCKQKTYKDIIISIYRGKW